MREFIKICQQYCLTSQNTELFQNMSSKNVPLADHNKPTESTPDVKLCYTISIQCAHSARAAMKAQLTVQSCYQVHHAPACVALTASSIWMPATCCASIIAARQTIQKHHQHQCQLCQSQLAEEPPAAVASWVQKADSTATDACCLTPSLSHHVASEWR